MHAPPPSPSQTIMLIALIAFVLAMRVLRMRRGRRLRLEWLWVWPTIIGAGAAAMLSVAPPPPLGWAACALAALIGGALGWQRARLVRVEIDPATHALTQRESPLAMFLVVAIVLGRQLVRNYAGAEAAALHMSALVVSDVLIVFALALFVVQRIVLWRRARALLDQARATGGNSEAA